MSLTIRQLTISSISVVDDDPSAREAYQGSVEDLELTSIPHEGPLPELDDFVDSLRTEAQAALCDHHLGKRNYATFNGGALVAKCYQTHFPALLCTAWEKAQIHEIRQYRRYLPVLFRPGELDVDTIQFGLERTLAEFDGEFTPDRKPWRTLLRVEEIDDEDGPNRMCHVVVPGWRPDEIISLPIQHIPKHVVSQIKPFARLHAEVNIGADRQEDLYFAEWEPR